MIRLLFKLCVILCLLFIAVSFFLPKQSAQKQGGGAEESSVGMFAGVAAVGALLHDMDGFCARSPQSCATGKSFFGLMAEKAQQGAEFTYQWLGVSFHKGAENTERHLTAQEKQAAQAAAPQPEAKEAAPPPARLSEKRPPAAERQKTARPEAAKKQALKSRAVKQSAPKKAAPKSRAVKQSGKRAAKQQPKTPPAPAKKP